MGTGTGAYPESLPALGKALPHLSVRQVRSGVSHSSAAWGWEGGSGDRDGSLKKQRWMDGHGGEAIRFKTYTQGSSNIRIGRTFWSRAPTL